MSGCLERRAWGQKMGVWVGVGGKEGVDFRNERRLGVGGV
jgi:hypothetical protein